MKLSRLHSVKAVRALFFPSRSERWIKDTFRTGDYGPVLRDAHGWLISEAAVSEYHARHAVGQPLNRPDQRANLVQFQSSSN